MLIRTLPAAMLAVASLAGAPHADEDIALAKNSMRLFGGPSMDYPRIGIITWGQGVRVLGCLHGNGWCEIVADGQRGWVPAAKLVWPSSARKTVDPSYGKYHVTI